MSYKIIASLLFATTIVHGMDREIDSGINLIDINRNCLYKTMEYLSPPDVAVFGQTCKKINAIYKKDFESYAIAYYLWANWGALKIQDFNLDEFISQEVSKNPPIGEFKGKLASMLKNKGLELTQIDSLKFNSEERFEKGFKPVELPLSILPKIAEFFKGLKTCHLNKVLFTKLPEGSEHLYSGDETHRLRMLEGMYRQNERPSFSGRRPYWRSPTRVEKATDCIKGFFQGISNGISNTITNIKEKNGYVVLDDGGGTVKLPKFTEVADLPLFPSSITDLSLRGCGLSSMGFAKFMKGLNNLKTLDISFNLFIGDQEMKYIPLSVCDIRYTYGQFHWELLKAYLGKSSSGQEKKVIAQQTLSQGMKNIRNEFNNICD